MPNYCPASGPILAFANSPSPQRCLYNITYFTCDIGFISSGGSVNPSFTCLSSSATSGTFSTITYSCERKIHYYLLSNLQYMKWNKCKILLLCSICRKLSDAHSYGRERGTGQLDRILWRYSGAAMSSRLHAVLFGRAHVYMFTTERHTRNLDLCFWGVWKCAKYILKT